jgi:hypothetical protein
LFEKCYGESNTYFSCEFNIDTASIEVQYANGGMVSINCTKVEKDVARNMYEASEQGWLVYKAPVDYVNLLLMEIPGSG